MCERGRGVGPDSHPAFEHAVFGVDREVAYVDAEFFRQGLRYVLEYSETVDALELDSGHELVGGPAPLGGDEPRSVAALEHHGLRAAHLVDHHMLVIVDKSEHIVSRDRRAAVVEQIVGARLIGMEHIDLAAVDRGGGGRQGEFLTGLGRRFAQRERIAEHLSQHRDPPAVSGFQLFGREADLVAGQHDVEFLFVGETEYVEQTVHQHVSGQYALAGEKLAEQLAPVFAESRRVAAQQRAQTALGLGCVAEVEPLPFRGLRL